MQACKSQRITDTYHYHRTLRDWMADKWSNSLAINNRWKIVPFSKYDKVADGAN
jgi:hypothetical protein